jgi:integrase
MELADVFFEEHRVRVMKGKGRKQRWTAVSEVALSALRTYLDTYRGWQPGRLFQTVKGRPLVIILSDAALATVFANSPNIG